MSKEKIPSQHVFKRHAQLQWLHIHEFSLPCGDTGTCIKRCHESSTGELWVSDDIRATQVNFCPACGFEAKMKVGE